MCVTDSTKSEETIHTNDRELPLGMGYKSCWMVAKAGTKERKLLVTSTYKKQNYVIGTPVSEFFYETEEFLEKCKDFPRVYVYMTHRVSETHGFALVENGELIRFFKYDENEIKNIGQPLPEEIALGYHLPGTFEDARDEAGNFTEVNEDVVVELAIRQVGIDVEQYPYKDVKVGKRFEYSAELAKDPYFREDVDVVTDEIRNLPVVQRFAATKTYREKLEILNETRDELTHSILEAFSEILEIWAVYGRLSDRIDYMCSILKDKAHYEEHLMTQEDFLNELSGGNFVFKDKIFDCFVFEGISCENLTFHKCTFSYSQFMEHQVRRLEFNDCIFWTSTFSGKWQNAVLILHKNFFCNSKIHDLEVMEAFEPSEMIDCEFSSCKFSDIKVRAKATVSGGSFFQCAGDGIEIANIDVGEEPEHSINDTFQNCSIPMI